MRPATLAAFGAAVAFGVAVAQPRKDDKHLDPINVVVPHVSTDKGVKIDYDIVYVRAPRAGDDTHKRFFADFSAPVTTERGADLMLLHPDGSEELLVKGGDGSVTDPMVSFDGQWVYYVHLHNMVKASQWSPPKQGSDISGFTSRREGAKLTNQVCPNTGAANWSKDYRTPGRANHTSVRRLQHGPVPAPVEARVHFEPRRVPAGEGIPGDLSATVRDGRPRHGPHDAEDPTNLEDQVPEPGWSCSRAADGRTVQHARIAVAATSSGDLDNQPRREIGTRWSVRSTAGPRTAPLPDAPRTARSCRAVLRQNNSGFGAYIKPRPGTTRSALAVRGWVGLGGWPGERRRVFKLPAGRDGGRQFVRRSPRRHEPGRSPPARRGGGTAGTTTVRRGITGCRSCRCTVRSRRSRTVSRPGRPSVRGDKTRRPSASSRIRRGPLSHLLRATPRPVGAVQFPPELDGGCTLIAGRSNQPSEMRLIKNDLKYNSAGPGRSSLHAIYGRPEPATSGAQGPRAPISALARGTPFGGRHVQLLQAGDLPERRRQFPERHCWPGRDQSMEGPRRVHQPRNGMPLNWHNQGAEAGLYWNDDIHAVASWRWSQRPTARPTQAGAINNAGRNACASSEILLRKFTGDSRST